MDISGFLFLYQPLSAGWFSSPWVQHYVSLTGTLLSYSLSPKASESPMTPCTRVSVEVSDRLSLNHVLQCIAHSINRASSTDRCHWVLRFRGSRTPSACPLPLYVSAIMPGMPGACVYSAGEAMFVPSCPHDASEN